MFCVVSTIIWLLLGATTIAVDTNDQTEFRRNQLPYLNDKGLISSKNIEPYVLGGHPAKSGEIPWQVYLQDGKRFFCGGAIISLRWVLTAAHCIEEAQKGSDFAVVAGSLSISAPEATTQRFTAQKMIIHPFYTKPRYDLALIEIDGFFEFNKYVSLIYITHSNTHRNVEHIPGVKCKISGWGRTSYSYPEFLQVADLPLVSLKRCNKSFGGIIISNMICAGDHRRGCFGDSGGPLMCKSHNDNNWFLAGIANFVHHDCSKPPTVFARIDHFYKWITDTVSSYPSIDN